MELRQLELALTVGRFHHRDVDAYIVEPDDAVHPTSLDGLLAFELHAELEEERNRSLEVVDNDADVVHPLDCHVLKRMGRGWFHWAGMRGDIGSARPRSALTGRVQVGVRTTPRHVLGTTSTCRRSTTDCRRGPSSRRTALPRAAPQSAT